MVLAHVSHSIRIVHCYIMELLEHVCPEKHVREQIRDVLVLDELQKRYTRAMEHARFLLRIERNGMPSTYNHYFNSEVQKKRQDRVNDSLESYILTYTLQDRTRVRVIPAEKLSNTIVDKANADQICEDILDNLESYYKVSRKRFVDVICRQVIGYYLLEGEESPLRVLCSDLVHGLDAEKLELIAGEDVQTKEQRAMLEMDIKNLEEAVKVLRR